MFKVIIIYFFKDYDASVSVLFKFVYNTLVRVIIQQDLKDFEETILQGVDFDKDGKVSRKELTMILLTLAKMNEQ